MKPKFLNNELNSLYGNCRIEDYVKKLICEHKITNSWDSDRGTYELNKFFQIMFDLTDLAFPKGE